MTYYDESAVLRRCESKYLEPEDREHLDGCLVDDGDCSCDDLEDNLADERKAMVADYAWERMKERI